MYFYLGIHQLVGGSTGLGHSLFRSEWQEKSERAQKRPIFNLG